MLTDMSRPKMTFNDQQLYYLKVPERKGNLKWFHYICLSLSQEIS